MNDIVTFYYPRDSKRGILQQIRAKSGETIFFVDGNGKLPQVNRGESGEDYKVRLRKGSTGALVVSLSEAEAAFSSISGQKQDLPDKVFKVGISGRATPINLDFNKTYTVKVEPWEHLVIPVDSKAEQQFVEFLGYLNSLPESYGTSILHMLRRPSIDSRLSRIEKSLGQASSSQSFYSPPAEAEGHGFSASGLRSWLATSLWGTALAAVIFIGLGAAGLKLYQKFYPSSHGTPTDSNQDKPDAPMKEKAVDSGASQSGEVTPETIATAYQHLLNKMATSPNPGIKSLLTSHDLKKQTWQSKNAAIALVKLELLHNGDLDKASLDLTNLSQLDDTKRELQKKKTSSQQGLNENWNVMNPIPELQFFSCQAYGVPKLVGTITIPDATCPPLPPDAALKGLQELTSWVSQ